MTATNRHPKIRADHLRRQAVVYIRQSSVQQVRGNRESTTRQYALTEQAKNMGWSAKSVQTIDEDQGRSGSGSEHRQGFKKLLAEIGAGQVGIVFALEASRLARSSVDWHRLVEICVVTQTLLADESSVYDPRDPNDAAAKPCFRAWHTAVVAAHAWPCSIIQRRRNARRVTLAPMKANAMAARPVNA